MKVLLTGADGFIGSHLAEALVESGYETRAFVYYNSFNSWGWLDTLPEAVFSRMEIVAGDIRDPYGVRAAVDGCDAVLHLAALIAIPFSYTAPDAYVDTNIKGTLNVLQAAREKQTRVLVTSTSEVYGTARYIPRARSARTGSPRAFTGALSCPLRSCARSTPTARANRPERSYRRSSRSC